VNVDSCYNAISCETSTCLFAIKTCNTVILLLVFSIVAIVAMLEIPIAYIESRPDGVDVRGLSRCADQRNDKPGESIGLCTMDYNAACCMQGIALTSSPAFRRSV